MARWLADVAQILSPVVLVVLVVLVGVAIGELRIRGFRIGLLLVRDDTQLSPQPVKIRAAAVVLELACNLDLLGLGSAAPHWLDPLERTGARSGPWSPHRLCCLHCADAGGLACTADRPDASPPPGTRRVSCLRTDITVPGLRAKRFRAVRMRLVSPRARYRAAGLPRTSAVRPAGQRPLPAVRPLPRPSPGSAWSCRRSGLPAPAPGRS